MRVLLALVLCLFLFACKRSSQTNCDSPVQFNLENEPAEFIIQSSGSILIKTYREQYGYEEYATICKAPPGFADSLKSGKYKFLSLTGIAYGSKQHSVFGRREYTLSVNAVKYLNTGCNIQISDPQRPVARIARNHKGVMKYLPVSKYWAVRVSTSNFDASNLNILIGNLPDSLKVDNKAVVLSGPLLEGCQSPEPTHIGGETVLV